MKIKQVKETAHSGNQYSDFCYLCYHLCLSFLLSDHQLDQCKRSECKW